jgi:hypothetical protein
MTELESLRAQSSDPSDGECDLTAQRVAQHFAAIGRRGQLLTFLLALDRLDRWTVDFAEMQSPERFDLQLFLHELSGVVHGSFSVLHRVPREFSEVLAHLTTTRCLYLIQHIAQRNPQFLDSLTFLLAAEAGSDPNLAAIRRRFEAFSRARLLGQIFSGPRLERIVSIMGSYTE